jgi:hypothetical protein
VADLDFQAYERAVDKAEELARILLQDPVGLIDESYYRELARLLILKLEEKEIEAVLSWYHSELGQKVETIGRDFIRELLGGNQHE